MTLSVEHFIKFAGYDIHVVSYRAVSIFEMSLTVGALQDVEHRDLAKSTRGILYFFSTTITSLEK